MLPESLLNSDDDWIERVRSWLYPRIHPILEEFGGYGVGDVSDNQLVGAVNTSEERFEEILVDNGFVRNPIACYKSHPAGMQSKGSWVLLPEDTDFLEEDRQLHITLFDRRDSREGREIFAHNEYDWRQKPKLHLNGKKFNPSLGIEQTHKVFSDEPRIEINDV